mmetsp:Transcript_40961/g.56957  ORF Transcript_40961/g.56957 Transcript_40961/m.56957 type:complete len:87 (-) Transcript_40961:3657-3917(-)
MLSLRISSRRGDHMALQVGIHRVATAPVLAMWSRTNGIIASGGATQLFSPSQSTVNVLIASAPGQNLQELNRLHFLFSPEAIRSTV